MSPERPTEMDELDALTTELAEAGRIARVAVGPRSRPDPVFTMRLRAELLDAYGSAMQIGASDAAAPDLIEALPRSIIESGPRAEDAAASLAPLAAAPAETPEPIERRRKARTLGLGFLTRPGRSTRPATIPAPEILAAVDDATPQGARARLRPSVRLRPSGQSVPSRWLGLGVAATLLVGLLAVGSIVLRPAEASSTADQAVAATLVRNGTETALTSGTVLVQGDEIHVGQGGLAYLNLASNRVRLDGGAVVRLDSLDPMATQVDQLAGRVYHRVLVPAGGTYTVVTGDVTWKAVGTAFDLDRLASATGEEVLGLALQHDLQVAAPGYYGAVQEGSSAVFMLNSSGAASGAPTTSAIDVQSLVNPWLVANAQLDSQLGLPLGELAQVLDATPRPEPTATPRVTQPPSATPAATVVSGSEPTAVPVTETKSPHPTATPRPTGPAYLGKLSTRHNADGSYTFSWPAYSGPGFEYYKLVYGPAGTQPNFDGSNYWACNEARGDTSWTGFVTPGDYAVRLQVVDESSGKIVIRAQTQVAHLNVSLPPTENLGNLNYHVNANGSYTFSWTPYTDLPFSYYKLVYEPNPGKDPSYPDGSSYWAAIDSGKSSVTLMPGSGGFDPGDWSVRIQAIDDPLGPPYAYAQTNVLHVTVSLPATPTPEPTPTPTPEPTPEPTPTA